jgi:hypothetical protein
MFYIVYFILGAKVENNCDIMVHKGQLFSVRKGKRKTDRNIEGIRSVF